MKTIQDHYDDQYSQGFQKLVKKALHRLKFQHQPVNKTTLSPIKVNDNIQRRQLVFSRKKTIHFSREEINSNICKLPFLCTPKTKLKGEQILGKFRKSQNQSVIMMLGKHSTSPNRKGQSQYLRRKCLSVSKKLNPECLYEDEQTEKRKEKQRLSPWDNRITMTENFCYN